MARVISSKSHGVLLDVVGIVVLGLQSDSFSAYAMALVVALSSWFPPTTVFEHGMEPVKTAAGEQHSGYDTYGKVRGSLLIFVVAEACGVTRAK